MRAAPNTTVTVLEPGAIDAFTGERTDTPVATGVPAFILERPATRPRTGSEGRRVDDPATGTPRIVRVVQGRLPDGTPVSRDSILLDERRGHKYAVKSVRQHVFLDPPGDILLELIRITHDDP